MGLLARYNGSHIKALVKLYPELTLKESFWMSKVGWKAPEKGRIFFDGFARSRNFNPLVAENWNSVTGDEIRRVVPIVSGRGFLSHYKGSHIIALKKLYPELTWKGSRFLRKVP